MTDSLSNFFGRLSDFSRVANVSAGETLPDVPTSVSTAVQAITASDAILGAVAIVIGAALMLLGFRLYRPTLFVTGAVIGGVITYSLLVHFRPSAGYEHEGDVLTFVPITLGLICGSILMCVVEVALILVGGVGGLIFGIYVLSWKPFEVANAGVGRIIFLVVCALIGVVVIHFAEKAMVVLSTSFTGAYGIIFGVDCFAKTGFTQDAGKVLADPKDYSQYVFHQDPKVIVMGVACIILFIGGVVFQYRMNKGKEKHSTLSNSKGKAPMTTS